MKEIVAAAVRWLSRRYHLPRYNHRVMPTRVRSHCKINLGLAIGPLRPDGFHELRTVYQTIALHDVLRVEVGRGSGIEVRCDDPRVPKDSSNTCWKIAERAAVALKLRGRIVISIDKRLPIQGGLGGASGNAVATLIALEIASGKKLSGGEKLRIAAEVGSDLPLFLIGGTILGVGHGEEVYPLPDLPVTPCVIVTPDVGVSTPKAFADWDKLAALPQGLKPTPIADRIGAAEAAPFQSILAIPRTGVALTQPSSSDRLKKFGQTLSAWLNGNSGVPGKHVRGRAETPLLDLVRTGIENDFEQVVFPQYPLLRDLKQKLERSGAFYASLSGSGSALYGLFATRRAAQEAAAKLQKSGTAAVVTSTLTRRQYWKALTSL